MSEGTKLTPEEEREYRDLRQQLHELRPHDGHDQDARQPIPPNVGRGELESLREEVKLARVKERGDDGPEPEIDDDHDHDPF